VEHSDKFVYYLMMYQQSTTFDVGKQ